MHRTVFTLRPVGVLAIMIIMTLAVVGYAYIATQPEGSADIVSDALPQVTGKINVKNNDGNAVIIWATPPIDKSISLNNRYTGFVVVYYDEKTPNNKLYKTTTAGVFGMQLQGLAPGVFYKGQVYTINSLGQVGLPSEIFTFKSDNAEVLALQKQFDEGKLAFLDLMNRPAGALDEKLWNIAGGTCNNTEGLAGIAINNQFHAHIGTADGVGCDRGTETATVRGTPIDLRNNANVDVGFTGDLGMRGPGRVYFTVTEEKYAGLDQDLRINLTGFGKDSAGLPQATKNAIEFSLGEGTIILKKTDATGVGRELATADLAKMKIPIDSNLQVPFLLSFSPNKISLKINDQPVLAYSEKDVMSATKHGFKMSTKTYNTNKVRAGATKNGPFASFIKLWHFDQVFITGKPSNDEVHNYKNFGNFRQEKLATGSSITLNISDPVVGKDNKPAKQMLKGIMAHTDKWAETDIVNVNGKSYKLPNPKDITEYTSIPDTGFINAARGIAFELEVELKTGENKISFSSKTRSMVLYNVHAELTFDKNQAPEYTQPSVNQPSEVNQLNGNIVGSDELLMSIAGVNVTGKSERAMLFDKTKALPVTSGNTRFVTKISGFNSRLSTGAFSDIIGADLSVDGVTVASKRLDADFPPPEATAYLDFNTANLATGIHKVEIKTWSKNCILGRTIISHAKGIKPYYINVDNKNTVNTLQPVTPICTEGVDNVSTAPTTETKTKKYKLDAKTPTLLHHLDSAKLIDPNNVIEPDADVTDIDENVSAL